MPIGLLGWFGRQFLLSKFGNVVLASSQIVAIMTLSNLEKKVSIMVFMSRCMYQFRPLMLLVSPVGMNGILLGGWGRLSVWDVFLIVPVMICVPNYGRVIFLGIKVVPTHNMLPLWLVPGWCLYLPIHFHSYGRLHTSIFYLPPTTSTTGYR